MKSYSEKLVLLKLSLKDFIVVLRTLLLPLIVGEEEVKERKSISTLVISIISGTLFYILTSFSGKILMIPGRLQDVNEFHISCSVSSAGESQLLN